MGERVEIHGAHRSYIGATSIEGAARILQNLVNIQGSGPLGIVPARHREAVQAALDQIDPARSWRDWWFRASGRPVLLYDSPIKRCQLPFHRLPSRWQPGRYLGINVGGHYLRRVWIVDGLTVGSDSVQLGTGSESTLVGVSVDDFVRIMLSDSPVKDLDGIGIAWSAPRVAGQLRAMSIQSQAMGDLSALLDQGTIDSALSVRCRGPVRSWNDGEAVAAGEVMTRGRDLTRPLLVLKLGTSIAAGMVTAEGVSALPLQLAKCLLETSPLVAYEHPVVGLSGTARDFLGAGSLRQTFAAVAGRPSATYNQFCDAVAEDQPVAKEILRVAAGALVELSEFVSRVWQPVDLVLTGKNLQHAAVCRFLEDNVERLFCATGAVSRLVPSQCDRDICAAVGAVILLCGTLIRKNL